MYRPFLIKCFFKVKIYEIFFFAYFISGRVWGGDNAYSGPRITHIYLQNIYEGMLYNICPRT